MIFFEEDVGNGFDFFDCAVFALFLFLFLVL